MLAERWHARKARCKKLLTELLCGRLAYRGAPGVRRKAPPRLAVAKRPHGRRKWIKTRVARPGLTVSDDGRGGLGGCLTWLPHVRHAPAAARSSPCALPTM